MNLEAITFALCLVCMEHRQWFDWLSYHIGMILQAAQVALETRMSLEQMQKGI